MYKYEQYLNKFKNYDVDKLRKISRDTDASEDKHNAAFWTLDHR